MSDTLLVILAVVLVLGIAINIHEFGHFIVAKMFGMRVEAYSFFGLGPRIWGFKWGHTDYRISAIPLGAYVKLYGDEATASLEGGSSEKPEVKDWLAERNISEDGPHKEKAEIVPDSELYELRPRWQKFLVMLGGPFMNIMLALAIPFGMGLYLGVPALTSPTVGVVQPGGAAEQSGLQVGDLITKFQGVANPSWQRIEQDAAILPGREIPLTVDRNGRQIDLKVTPSKTEQMGNTIGKLDFEPSEPVIVQSVQDNTPSQIAGVQRGDRIISLNGTAVSGRESFIALVQENKNAPFQIGALRNGQTQNFTLTAQIQNDGHAIIGANISSQPIDRVKSSVGEAAWNAVDTNLNILRLTGTVFGQLFSGQRSVKDAGLAGPVGIVQMIAQIFHEDGFIGLVPMLMLISLNLGVFNLLPIPLLDGGQIAVLAIEKIMSFFGATLSMAIKERIQLTGLAIILLLMVFTLFLDVSRFFK
jgi:regulator of sigma E protease